MCLHPVDLVLELVLPDGQGFKLCDLPFEFRGDISFGAGLWSCEFGDDLLDLGWECSHVCFEDVSQLWFFRLGRTNA